MAQGKGRRPRTLRLPGILPEPGQVEAGGSPRDQEVLRDLEEALPEEREGEGGERPRPVPPAPGPRPRARPPGRRGAAFLAAGGALCLAAAFVSPGASRWAFAGVGLVLLAMAARAARSHGG